MGNLFSSRKNQMLEIEERLKTIEDLDQNKDGTITRDELDAWKERQQKDLDAFKANIISTKQKEHEEHVNDLLKQIECLKQINSDLEKQMSDLVHHSSRDNSENEFGGSVVDTSIFSELSKQRIQEIIDRLIDDKTVNIRYIPDFAERQIYKNIFNVAFGLLNEVVSHGSIDVLGHQITMQMNAKANQITNNDDEEEEN